MNTASTTPSPMAPPEIDPDTDAVLDADVEQEVEPGEAYPFECTRVELFSGALRVGDDLDPSSIIEHATRYTSIAVESAQGGRVIDIWRTADFAVVHDAAGEDAAPGIVLSRDLLELHVAASVVTTIGELTALRATSVAVDENADGFVLLIGSGSPGDEGPKAAVINTEGATFAGIAPAGTDEIDARPVSAITAWAMIVEALRSEPLPT